MPQMPSSQDILQVLSQMQKPTLPDAANAISETYLNSQRGAPSVSAEAAMGQRLAPQIELLKSFGPMMQMQLELSKIDEQMRHDRATENLNPQAQTISTGPTYGGPVGFPPAQNTNAPLSVQNNNPGNMRPVGSSTGFQQFGSSDQGLAAMRNDLLGKIGGNSPAMNGQAPTLRNIITTWAPPSENNTEAYIASVSKKTGLAPDQQLQPGDVDKLIPAMVNQEGGRQATQYFNQPQNNNQPFMPLFRGNEVMKDNLPQNFAYVSNPNGGMMARQVPGTIEKGANGEVLTQDAQGNVTQQIPPNPMMKAKLEQNLQLIAKKFDELQQEGATVELFKPDPNASMIKNTVNGIGNFTNNKLNQLASTKGIDFGNTQILPGGQQFAQGSKAQVIRDEIQSLIKQTTPLYMQAMGITPGMERAVSAQQMLQEALGGAVGKSREENMFSLANLSRQAGTGQLAQQLQSQAPQSNGWSIQEIK